MYVYMTREYYSKRCEGMEVEERARRLVYWTGRQGLSASSRGDRLSFRRINDDWPGQRSGGRGGRWAILERL